MSLRRMASLSGFDITNNDLMKPAQGDNFRRRMSLASLGTRRYGGSLDCYSEGGGEEGRQVQRKVIVRHVPIVIEESQDEFKKARKLNTSENKNQLSFSKFSQVWNIPYDLSSLSSLSSENSLDSISRLDKIEEVVNAWMMRKGDKGSIGMSENSEGKNVSSKVHKEVATSRPSDLKRKPFTDISQNKVIPNQRKAPPKTSIPEPHYLNKTDTGLRNCPVHKQGPNDFGRKESKTDNTSCALKTPSLIRRNSTRIKNTNNPINESKVNTERPQHVTNVPISKAKENKAAETPEMKTFSRGPGQWSFKGSKSKIKDNKNKSGNDQNQAKSQNSKATFQQSWSFRKPSSFSENIPSNIKAVLRPTQPKSHETVLGMKTGSKSNNKQTTPMKKSSSQNDLNVASKNWTQSQVARMMPSVSTSSIPSMVTKEFEGVPRNKPPCVGILKTPGKCKISLNNRVEFLNNVREREIPGRHA